MAKPIADPSFAATIWFFLKLISIEKHKSLSKESGTPVKKFKSFFFKLLINSSIFITIYFVPGIKFKISFILIKDLSDSNDLPFLRISKATFFIAG